MESKIIVFRSGPISPFVKTSIPKRSGILKRLSLVNSGLPFLVSVTSLISNLAALLPISMAAILIFSKIFWKFSQNSRKNFFFKDRKNQKKKATNHELILFYKLLHPVRQNKFL